MHEICTTKFEWGCIIEAVFFIQKQTKFYTSKAYKTRHFRTTRDKILISERDDWNKIIDNMHIDKKFEEK